MTTLIERCTKAAAVLAIAAAACGCSKKDEYASAQPAASGSPGPGAAATGTASAGRAPLTVDVVAVDTKVPSITVTSAVAGSSTADDKEAGTSRGTAGAIADRRTLPVDPSVSSELSRIEPGQRVDIVCADPVAGPGATGATAAGATPAPSDPLTACVKVTAIMPAGGPSGGL
jgi:hypothetical protein